MRLVDRRSVILASILSVMLAIASLTVEQTVSWSLPIPDTDSGHDSFRYTTWGWPVPYVVDTPGTSSATLDRTDRVVWHALFSELAIGATTLLYARGLYGLVRGRLASRQLVGAAVLSPVIAYLGGAILAEFLLGNEFIELYGEPRDFVSYVSFPVYVTRIALIGTTAFGLPIAWLMARGGAYSRGKVVFAGFIGGLVASRILVPSFDEALFVAPFTALFGVACAVQFTSFAKMDG